MTPPENSSRPLFSGLQPLVDSCVHCGFCLATCPSYLVLGQEMDSPRGRVYLMKAGLEDRLPLSDAVVRHFDTCLGCMACETACPSGVRYAPLIEHTRAAVETYHQRTVADRLFRTALFRVLPFPARLRALALPLALARWIASKPSLLALLPERIRSLTALSRALPDRVSGEIPERTTPAGPVRARVGLLTGCVQQTFFGHVNEATVRVLAAAGCEVVAPRTQACCGALALHAGLREEARQSARAVIAAFEAAGVDEVVVNAAGCGSAMKEYGELLAHDPQWSERARRFSAAVRDVSETLDRLAPSNAPRHPLPLRAAYHDACHLAHAQGIRQEPRRVLASIPGLTLVPLDDADVCCGSAGIFNLVEPALAAAVGQRKASALADSGADVIVTSNPGCMIQMTTSLRKAGHDIPVIHLMELLDASLQGVVPDAVRRGRTARPA